MIKFKYYKTDNKFRSDLSTGNKIDSDDIVFVEDSGILSTHDLQWGFVDRISGILPLSDDWAILKGGINQGPTIIHKWPGSNGAEDTYATVNFPYLYSGDNLTLATTNDISVAHANDATVTDVQNLSGTTASIDINDFVDAVETVLSAGYVNAELQGSVVYITNKNNVTRSIDLFSTYDEVVYLSVYTSVVGVSVSNLAINVYYDEQTIPAQTVITDANGEARFTVPSGTTYKVVFPSIAGCKSIGTITHRANLNLRSIEVTYTEQDSQSVGTLLTVFVADANATGQPGVTALLNFDISISIDGDTDTYTTGSDGKILLTIPYNSNVTVTTTTRSGYELRGTTSRTFVSNQSAKYIDFIYTPVEAGLFIVDNNGTEYTYDQFASALSQNTITEQDAKLIKVTSDELAANNGVFYVSIDMLATRSGIVSKKWANRSELFFDIPLNGNSTSAAYYYDGRTASGLILDEGDRLNNDTPAVDEALSKTFDLSSATLYGFLGSVGQWAILWANRNEIDDILFLTRPSATYNFSSYTTNKWTSTQSSASLAYFWTASASTNGKGYSSVVVPFFAF